MILFLSVASLLQYVGCGERHPEQPLTADWSGTLKMDSARHNPIIDFNYAADPTAIEYDGRLYIYATNDQQQCDETHPDSANTYEHINSLIMASTRDMVNWTYHGLIPTKQLAPWIIASWAPSICSRVEADGQTHFYLYFSNSGFGTGVLTATSPVGPWTSPLDHSLVDAENPQLRDCPAPFDPGVAIDAEGTGWIAFGAKVAKMARLGQDMISIDGPFITLPAQCHFEANEINFIGGRMIYSYNVNWTADVDWRDEVKKPARPAMPDWMMQSSNPFASASSGQQTSTSASKPAQTAKSTPKQPTKPSANAPSRCSMVYMLLEGDPYKAASWKYKQPFMRNPGDDGFDYSNNHTHIHKYQGRWYIFGHTMDLRHQFGHKGGYRNLVVENIDVDEQTPAISMSHYTRRGVEQISTVSPFMQQEIETTAGTLNVHFEATDVPGNMVATSDSVGVVLLRGVLFNRDLHSFVVTAQGSGQVDLRIDNPMGQLVASTYVDSDSLAETRSSVLASPQGIHDVVILFKGKDLKVDKWQMK